MQPDQTLCKAINGKCGKEVGDSRTAYGTLQGNSLRHGMSPVAKQGLGEGVGGEVVRATVNTWSSAFMLFPTSLDVHFKQTQTRLRS